MASDLQIYARRHNYNQRVLMVVVGQFSSLIRLNKTPELDAEAVELMAQLRRFRLKYKKSYPECKQRFLRREHPIALRYADEFE